MDCTSCAQRWERESAASFEAREPGASLKQLCVALLPNSAISSLAAAATSHYPTHQHLPHLTSFACLCAARWTHIDADNAPDRDMKRSRTARDVRTPDTLTTPYLGPIDHNKEPIRPIASSVLTSASRCDVSHANWGTVASNATTAALEPETVVSLLQDASFRPGPRPATFARDMGTWVFKEGRDFHIRGKAAAGHHSDRWCASI